MTRSPPRWSAKQLETDAVKSADEFRTARLAPTQAWRQHFLSAFERFDTLFSDLSALDPAKMSDVALSKAYRNKLGEALRYLAGPPISDDDLRVLAKVPSL